MNSIAQLFAAFVAPAIFVSAEGLLLLSLNVRLMGMVSRLRSYLHYQHAAARDGRILEAEAYASQIASIQRRAEMIRGAFVATLYSLLGTVATCLLLGLGFYWPFARLAAVLVFVASMGALLTGTTHYIRELRVALTSVCEEVADSRFMDAADSARAEDEKEKPSLVLVP
jgi:hypothetical protein